jgi:protease I
VAILATVGFEQSELEEPRSALRKAGAHTEIVSPQNNEVRGWADDEWADSFEVDVQMEEARAADYDALVLPGGVMNPDQLRMVPGAVDFVREFFDAGKPVAAICHGPQLLIEAGVLRGRTVTSYPSLRTDLTNAGAHWVNERVVVDNGLVTSRTPDDLPYFNEKLIEEIAEGVHTGQHT